MHFEGSSNVTLLFDFWDVRGPAGTGDLQTRPTQRDPKKQNCIHLQFCQDHYRQIRLTNSIQLGLAIWFCFGLELPAHTSSLAWIRAGRAAITPLRVNTTEPT